MGILSLGCNSRVAMLSLKATSLGCAAALAGASTRLTLMVHAGLTTAPTFALISAVPGVRAVTSPSGLTPATCGALLDQLIASLICACFPPESIALNSSFVFSAGLRSFRSARIASVARCGADLTSAFSSGAEICPCCENPLHICHPTNNATNAAMTAPNLNIRALVVRCSKVVTQVFAGGDSLGGKEGSTLSPKMDFRSAMNCCAAGSSVEPFQLARLAA